jgi:hypothetical protein
MYEPVDGDWVPAPTASARLTSVFGPIFDGVPENLNGVSANGLTKRQNLVHAYLREHFLACVTPIRITVISEAPIGIGILEESAFAVALSRALIKKRNAGTKADALQGQGSISEEQRLAGLLLGAWHTHMSWATIIGSMCDPSSHQGLLFDRSRAADLLPLYRDWELTSAQSCDAFRENVLPARRFWDTPYFALDTSVSIWYPETDRVPLCHLRIVDPIKTADQLEKFRDSFNIIADQMFVALSNKTTEDERIGWLMQTHQLLLNLANLVRPEAAKTLKDVNGIKGVLGAKLTSARGNGAIVVLAQPGSEPQLEKQMKRIGFISLSTTVQRFAR